MLYFNYLNVLDTFDSWRSECHGFPEFRSHRVVFFFLCNIYSWRGFTVKLFCVWKVWTGSGHLSFSCSINKTTAVLGVGQERLIMAIFYNFY